MKDVFIIVGILLIMFATGDLMILGIMLLAMGLALYNCKD